MMTVDYPLEFTKTQFSKTLCVRLLFCTPLYQNLLEQSLIYGTNTSPLDLQRPQVYITIYKND